MKTAMQQMIKATNSAISSVDPKDVHVGLVLEAVKYKANKLLAVEKEQLIKFAFDFYYTMSHKNGVPEHYITENRDHAEIYFDKVLMPTPHQ